MIKNGKYRLLCKWKFNPKTGKFRCFKTKIPKKPKDSNEFIEENSEETEKVNESLISDAQNSTTSMEEMEKDNDTSISDIQNSTISSD